MVRCLSLPRLLWLSALLTAVVLGAVAGGGSRAARTQAASAQLAFSPSSTSVAAGGSVAVDITVANVSNLGGYDVHLQFNPAKVHVASMTDSAFVTSGGNIVVCNPATIDNSAGTATDACATVSIFGTPGPGVSTTGPTALLRVSFTGVGAGKSVLTLTGSTLEDPNGAPIAATLGTGSITTVASVGGVTELTGVSALPAQTSAADSTRRLFFVVLLAVGLLAVAAACVGYAMRVRRRL